MSEPSNEFNNDMDIYKTLLESTKAIPWKIDWASMKFTYIGPQIESLLGWSQDSWVSAEDWATRMHPEDRDYVVNFCISQSKNGVDHEADYRALSKNGSYVWIRDVVHVVRDEQGKVDSLIGFMFDISERKNTEEKLIALQNELEALSFKDGLTGIANRRMFDLRLDIEWASARRSQQPISLIVLDVDFFKQYNDLYGHVQGDKCLTNVAQTLNLAAGRPKDVTARFGGEEFALLLPETDESAALQIAERCLRFIHELKVPHKQSGISQFLTASLGVGTVTPTAGMESEHFIHAVDELLYAAKKKGRNRIESRRL